MEAGSTAYTDNSKLVMVVLRPWQAFLWTPKGRDSHRKPVLGAE